MIYCFSDTLDASSGRRSPGSTGRRKRSPTNSSTGQQPASKWLAEHGPKELESLFRAIIFQPSAPILIADNDRTYQEASVGAAKFLGLPREKLIGRSLDEFAVPEIKPVISK